MFQETDFLRFEVIPCVPATALTPRLKPISKDEGISGIKMAIKTRYSVVHIECATTCTLGPTDNDFGYNEHSAVDDQICLHQNTDCMQKVLLQLASSYNEQFVLHLWTSFKWDLVFTYK